MDFYFVGRQSAKSFMQFHVPTWSFTRCSCIVALSECLHLTALPIPACQIQGDRQHLFAAYGCSPRGWERNEALELLCNQQGGSSVP